MKIYILTLSGCVFNIIAPGDTQMTIKPIIKPSAQKTEQQLAAEEQRARALEAKEDAIQAIFESDMTLHSMELECNKLRQWSNLHYHNILTLFEQVGYQKWQIEQTKLLLSINPRQIDISKISTPYRELITQEIEAFITCSNQLAKLTRLITVRRREISSQIIR